MTAEEYAKSELAAQRRAAAELVANCGAALGEYPAVVLQSPEVRAAVAGLSSKTQEKLVGGKPA